jgi:hypothetical protein
MGLESLQVGILCFRFEHVSHYLSIVGLMPGNEGVSSPWPGRRAKSFHVGLTSAS